MKHALAGGGGYGRGDVARVVESGASCKSGKIGKDRMGQKACCCCCCVGVVGGGSNRPPGLGGPGPGPSPPPRQSPRDVLLPDYTPVGAARAGHAWCARQHGDLLVRGVRRAEVALLGKGQVIPARADRILGAVPAAGLVGVRDRAVVRVVAFGAEAVIDRLSAARVGRRVLRACRA